MKKFVFFFSSFLICLILIIFLSIKIDNTRAEDGFDLSGKDITTQISSGCNTGYSIADEKIFQMKDGGYSYKLTSTCDSSKSLYAFCIDAHKQTSLNSKIVICENFKIVAEQNIGAAVIKMYQHFIDKGGNMNNEEYWALRDSFRIMSWAFSISSTSGANATEVAAYNAVRYAFEHQIDSVTVSGYNALVSEYLTMGLKGALKTDSVDSESYVVEANQTSVSEFEFQGDGNYKIELKYKILGLDKFHTSNSYAKITSIVCPEGITCTISNLNENLGTVSGNETEVTVTVIGTMGAINEKLNSGAAKFTIATWNVRAASNILVGAKTQNACGNTQGLQKYIMIPNQDIPATVEVQITLGKGTNPYNCNKDGNGYYLENDGQKTYVSFQEWVQSGCCANVTAEDLTDNTKKEQYTTYCSSKNNCDLVCTDEFKNSSENNKTWCKNNCYKCDIPSSDSSFDKDAFNKNDCCSEMDQDDPLFTELCPKYVCQPEYSELGVNTCDQSVPEEQRVTYIHESDNYEKCIINNEDIAGNSYNVSTSIISESNAYCTVSCKEDYDFYLPTSRINVPAGTYFFLNAGIIGKRTCVSGHANEYDQSKVGTDIEAFKDDLCGTNNPDCKINERSTYDETVMSELRQKITGTTACPKWNDIRDEEEVGQLHGYVTEAQREEQRKRIMAYKNAHPELDYYYYRYGYNLDADGSNKYSSFYYCADPPKPPLADSVTSIETFRESKYGSDGGLNQLLYDATDLYNMNAIYNAIAALAATSEGKDVCLPDGKSCGHYEISYDSKKVLASCDLGNDPRKYDIVVGYVFKAYYKGQYFVKKGTHLEKETNDNGGTDTIGWAYDESLCISKDKEEQKVFNDDKGQYIQDNAPNKELSENYETFVNIVQNLKDTIENDVIECSTWTDKVDFDFNPKIDYWYDEDSYMTQVMQKYNKAVFTGHDATEKDILTKDILTKDILTNVDTKYDNESSTTDNNTYTISKDVTYCTEEQLTSDYANCTHDSENLIDYQYLVCQDEPLTDDYSIKTCDIQDGTINASAGTKVEMSAGAIFRPEANFYTLTADGSVDIDQEGNSLYSKIGRVFPVSITAKPGTHEYRLGFYDIGLNADGTLGRIVKKTNDSVDASYGSYALYGDDSNQFDHACGYEVNGEVCKNCSTGSNVTLPPSSCPNCTTGSTVSVIPEDGFSFRPVSTNDLFPNSSNGVGYIDIKNGTDKVLGLQSESSTLKVLNDYDTSDLGSKGDKDNDYSTNSYTGSLGNNLDKNKVGKNWTNKKGKETIEKIENAGSEIYNKSPDYSFEINSTQMKNMRDYAKSNYGVYDESEIIVRTDSKGEEYHEVRSSFLDLQDGKYFTWDPDPNNLSNYGFSTDIRTNPSRINDFFESYESSKENGYGPSWK